MPPKGEQADGAGLLNPKQTRDVAVQLVLAKTVSPGTYSGTLTMAVVGGSESHTIPLTVTVLAAKKPSRLRPTLFALCPGLSRVLPSGSTTLPPTVAYTQPSGVLALDFGQVPLARTVQFSDCLRLTFAAAKTAGVTLTLSGPAAKVIQRVGFWAGKAGVVYSGLSLKAGQTTQLAFQFDVASKALLGSHSGTLTVTARLPNGSLQQSEVAITLDVVSTNPAPKPSASTSPSPSTKPSASPSPSSHAASHSSTPSPSPSRSATAVPTVSPHASPSPTASPTPSHSASASPSPTPSASAKAVAALASLIGGLTRALASLV